VKAYAPRGTARPETRAHDAVAPGGGGIQGIKLRIRSQDPCGRILAVVEGGAHEPWRRRGDHGDANRPG